MSRRLKAKLSEFIDKHGRHGAEIRLIAAGISRSSAQKLLAGTYPNEPRLLMHFIDQALNEKEAS